MDTYRTCFLDLLPVVKHQSPIGEYQSPTALSVAEDRFIPVCLYLPPIWYSKVQLTEVSLIGNKLYEIGFKWAHIARTTLTITTVEQCLNCCPGLKATFKLV
jgi:hypothetical protein